MYATVNLPGSSHFEYYGPASKRECQEWLNARVAILRETEQVTSLLPQQIVTNKVAQSWKYQDGSQVCDPDLQDERKYYYELPEPLPCGCPGTSHARSCPGFGLE